MKVSATEENGLKCLIRLAIAWEDGRQVTIPEVARAEGLSPMNVAKLVGILRRGGLVRSVRGVKGGIRLARPPAEVSVADALVALAGSTLRAGRCTGPAGGLPCPRSGDCGLRDVWSSLDALVQGVTSRVSLADLAAGRGPALERLPAAAAAGGRRQGVFGVRARWAGTGR